MGVKLHPQMSICPGCPGKKLPTLKASTLIISDDDKPDTKVATVYTKPSKNTFRGLF